MTFDDIAGLPENVQAAIERLAREGITKGTSATTFDPDGPVTRWQMAVFLDRILDAVDPSEPLFPSGGTGAPTPNGS